LPRRSSTAAGCDGDVPRRSPGHVWSRADLRGAADRSGDVLRAEGARARSVAAPGARAAGCGAPTRDHARLAGHPAPLRREEGLEGVAARRPGGGAMHRGSTLQGTGPAGDRAGPRGKDDDPGTGGRPAARSGAAQLHGDAAESVVGLRPHVRRELGGIRLCRVRDRCVLPSHRGVARLFG
jgi:hypothetical protein